MNTFTFSLISSAVATLVLSGCSLLMPYKDEFRCNKGVGAGYCASMSENYEEIQKSQKISRKPRNQSFEDGNYSKQDIKTIGEMSTCQKCEDTNEAIWLKQRELQKKYGIK